MTNTAETIQQIKDFRSVVRETMASREIISFDVNSIEIDNEKMSIGGDALSENATKRVLSQLRVKNNFLGLSKELTPGDWQTVKEKIKMSKANQIIHGRKVKDGSNMIIDDIYMAAPKTTGLMEIESIFAEVEDSIISTAKDVSLKSTVFLEDKDEVSITLLENDSPIDVFMNGSDMWKTGKRITWNGMNFSVAPFFERLVCSNGNTAPQYGFKANISNNKFNIEKIKAVLQKEITLQSESIENYLADATNHLKYTNISVNEFLRFGRFFNEVDHPEIIKKWFDSSYLNKKYSCIVSEMPDRWQVTADAGKNAYDFFNDLTYIASHPDDAKLSDRERVELQIKASDLLFKKKLDMELVAPQVKWN